MKTLLGGAFTVREEGDISESCSRFWIEITQQRSKNTTLHKFVTTVDLAIQCERCGVDWDSFCAAKPNPAAWDQLWADSRTYQRAIAPPIKPGDTRRRCAYCTWPFEEHQDAVRRCLRCGADLR